MMVERDVAFFRETLQLLHKKTSLEYLMPKKQWTVCRFKRGHIEKLGMVLLSVSMVGDRGSYLDVHSPIHNVNWKTSAITSIWNIYSIILNISCSTSSYVQYPYHSLARNTECLLLYFCRCHYFVEQ